MANDPDGLPIAEALAFADLEYVDLKNAIVQSGYRAAPKTRARGVPRVFDLDQLVAAFVFGQLKMRRVVAGFACRIANDVHRLIKKDHSIARLSAWKVKHRGQQPRVVVAEEAPQPTAIELFRFEIHDIKLKALDGMRERQKQQYASATHEDPPEARRAAGRAGSEGDLKNPAGSVLSGKVVRPANFQHEGKELCRRMN
jgi:hypothetical protein